MLASELCELAEQHMDKALKEIKEARRHFKYLRKQHKAVRKKLGVKKGGDENGGEVLG